MKITIDTIDHAPACYALCIVTEQGFWDADDSSILIQNDSEFTQLAIDFGWFDTNMHDIDGAISYLDSIVGSGIVIDDPGYFT